MAPAMAICTGQGNRVTATVVNPSIIKRMSGYISVPTAASNSGAQARAHHVLNRVLIKAVPKGGGKGEGKNFTLKNVNTAELSSCNQLKALIKEQLCDDIESGSFDVGFIDGSNVVRIRTHDDLKETWTTLMKGGKTTFWCDGLFSEVRRQPSKRGQGRDEVDDAPSKKRKTYEHEERVQEIFEKLKKTHPTFTPMQLRIWAEMVQSGMYPSLEEPPNTSMFHCAGGSTATKQKEPKDGFD